MHESMHHHAAHPESKHKLAAGQTHEDMHTGRGVIAMPTHEDIAKRAYDIYVKSGRKDGQNNENWYRAENELIHISHQPQ
jgi:hypothetical protein